jgi:hypothetical protein
LQRLHIIASATACLSLIATILIAAPAQAGTAQRSTTLQERVDQPIRADTSLGVQSVAWDQGLSPGRSASPLHENAKKHDGVYVMDGNAPGSATVQTQSPSGSVRITVPGKKSETRPAQLKGVPIGHFIGEGAPLLTTALTGATTTTYSIPHGSQTLITVESDKAPRYYRFPLALSAGSTAKVEADGSVLIRDAAGRVTSTFLSPWAFDADGKPVPTTFRIEDGILVQRIDFNSSNAFPITADPSIQWVPWPVLAISGAELQVLAGLTATVFVGGTWAGCTFSKLTGWIARVVSQICTVIGVGGVASVIAIINGTFRGAHLVATKCYGINLSSPSSPLRDMPGRDCGF